MSNVLDKKWCSASLCANIGKVIMNLFVITILLIISSALSGYLVFFAFDKYLVVNEFAKFFLCLVLVVIIFYFFVLAILLMQKVLDKLKKDE